MTIKEATHHIKRNQPMPLEAEYDQEQLDRIGEVMEVIRAHPQAFDLVEVMSMVGDGDAGGHFETLEEIIQTRYPSDAVLAGAKEILTHGTDSSALWVSHWISLLARPASGRLCIDIFNAIPFASVRKEIARGMKHCVDVSDLHRVMELRQHEVDMAVRAMLDESIDNMQQRTGT